MKICKNCGNQLPDYMSYCNFCGTPANGTPPSPQGYDQNSQQYPQQDQNWNNQQYSQQDQNWNNQQYPQQNQDWNYQQYGYAQQGQYNSYAPQPQSVTAAPSGPKKGLATVFIVLLVIIGVAAAGSIFYMLTTGYYSLSFSESAATKDPVTIPASYGEIDRDELNIANALNTSGVVDMGDHYYAVSGGGSQKYEIRRYAIGTDKSEVVYSSTLIIMSLGYYDGRLYFLQDNGEKGCVYSIDIKGKDVKTELDDYDVYGLFIYGSHAYFTSNQYGSSGEGGLVGRLDLETKKKDVLRVLDYSTILTVLEYKGYVYIHYSNNSNYRGHLLVSQADYPSVTNELSPVGGLDEDIYSLTVLDGKIYFSNIKNGTSYSYRTTYTMDPDGTNVNKIADTAGSYMIGYGDYIFYSQIKFGDDDTQKIFEVRRMNKDGSGDGYLCAQHVMYPGIAGEKIYYYDYDSGTYNRMSLDGRSSSDI